MDFKGQQQPAIDIMRAPPVISSKLTALDALDRLALNPSGWFPDRVLRKLTEARVSIIVDRWTEALVTLEAAATAMETFIEVLRDGGTEGTKAEAMQRAADELAQCAKVQEFVGLQSVGSGV